MRRLILFVVALSFVAMGVWAGGASTPIAPVRVGNEFVVNSEATDTQFDSSVGARPGGGFVVSWATRPFAGPYSNYDSGLFAQRFNRRGEPLGSQLQANSTPVTGYTQLIHSSTGVAPNGNFVVTWNAYDFDQLGFYRTGNIHLRRFMKDGTALDDDVDLGTGKYPKIAFGPDNSYVVTWTGWLYNLIRAQRFLPDGTPDGTPLLVTGQGNEYDMHSAVATRTDGSFLVVWARGDSEGFGQADRIRAQRYASDGSPLGTAFRVNPVPVRTSTTPEVAVTPDGGSIVVWTGPDGDGSGVFARRFNAADQPATGAILVNAATTGFQRLPSITVNDDGSFTVVWEAPGAVQEIVARHFAADATPLSGELTLDQHTAGYQVEPQVAGNGLGDFLVVWESDGVDGDSRGISGQLFRAAELFTDGFESGDVLSWSAIVP